MSNNGDPRPRPSGFMANIRAAYTPRPLTEEEALAPLVKPRSVVIAGWMMVLAGVIFIISSILVITGIDTAVADARYTDAQNVAECSERVGGIGTNVTTTPQDADVDLAQACRDYLPLTEQTIEDYRSTTPVVAVVFMVLGAALVGSGFNLSKGLFWARRAGVAVTLVIALAVFLGALPSPWFLPGSLLAVAASIMMYIGMAGRYFVRVRVSQSR